MTLKSHYIYYNTLWPANTLFTSKYWVYGLCVSNKLLLHYIYAVMIEIKLYCLYIKCKDSAHSSSTKDMQAIPCTRYQGKSGTLGHR